MIETRYGRWTMLNWMGLYAQVRCDCGTERVVNAKDLRAGKSRSCGCARAGKKRPRTHGQTHTPAWNSWQKMRARCLNPNHHKYGQYGGRGIVICEAWASFEAFLADMGERPVGMTLDRLDVDGPYAPENCRWATQLEQARNRQNSVLVITPDHGPMTPESAAALYGLRKSTLLSRLRAGWDHSEACRLPLGKRPPRAACRSGHAMTPENTYWYRGLSQCRACRRAAMKRLKVGAGAAGAPA